MNINHDIEEIVDKYINIVIRTAFIYVKNIHDAEDISQHVFLSLYMKKPNFDCEEKLKAWLIKAAINKSKDVLKSNWVKKTLFNIDEINIAVNDKYDNVESDFINSELFKLNKKYRTVLYLFYYEQYSTIEIAKIIGISENNVRTRLNRARNLLKSSLTKEYSYE